MTNQKVILYSTGCPQCRVLKGMLDKQQVEYEECTDRSTMLRLGFDSVPVLEVEGRYLNAKQAQKYLYEGVLPYEEQ